MIKRVYGTGKRKSSIARVFLKRGSGIIRINNKLIEFSQYDKFSIILRKPLVIMGLRNDFDIDATVKGGGRMGQAEAIKHGISRALAKLSNKSDDSNSYKRILRKLGFLTRDSRIVERKKVGRRKARKKEQYSKR